MITKIVKISNLENLRLALIGCASFIIAAETIWALIKNNAEISQNRNFRMVLKITISHIMIHLDTINENG